jgi:hypothetical protein
MEIYKIKNRLCLSCNIKVIYMFSRGEITLSSFPSHYSEAWLQLVQLLKCQSKSEYDIFVKPTFLTVYNGYFVLDQSTDTKLILNQLQFN